MRNSSIIVHKSFPSPQNDSLCVIRDSFLVFSHGVVGDCSIDEGVFVELVFLKGCGELGDGSFVVVLGVVLETQVVVLHLSVFLFE